MLFRPDCETVGLGFGTAALGLAAAGASTVTIITGAGEAFGLEGGTFNASSTA